MTSTFQELRNALKKSENIREIDISKEHLTTTYCWGNTLLHSAIRRTKEGQDDVNLDNVKTLLEKAKEYKNIDAVLALQMRWEGDDESIQTNRYKKVDDNLLLMAPLTFAICEGKEKAVEEILNADKKIAYKFLAQDILNNISSTHEKKTEFYAKISTFVELRSNDPDIKVVQDALREAYTAIKVTPLKLLEQLDKAVEINLYTLLAKLAKSDKEINLLMQNKDTKDDDLIAVLTAKYDDNITLLEKFALDDRGQRKANLKLNLVLEEIKDRKEVLKKVLLNPDYTLLHFAILNKSTEAFEAILEAVKDDKEILKAVLTAETHHYLHYYRTPLEFCIYHYSQCNDYKSKSEENKEITKDVKEATGSFGAWDYTNDEDFKKIKNFTETILNSARDNNILEDVLIASGIRKDLAKRLSDEKYSNDVIINMLQQNQKAEERGSKVGIVSGLITLPSLILICTKCAKMSTGWSVAIGIVSAIAVTYAIGYGVYKFNQPSTKMLETDANQESAKPGINVEEQTV